MSKKFWIVIVAVVAVLIGIFALTGDKSNNTSGSSTGATNHTIGSGSTGVTVVEYGDYQCPYCQTYYATTKQAVEEYKDQITFQFVNFPLTSLHQNAFAAARAAEAADKQGKYWEMHDALYANNDPSGASGWVASSAPTKYFDKFAAQLGLNVDQFKKDYASSAVNSAINADMAKAKSAGVDATPTFYVNGKKVTIENSAAGFKKVFDEAIASKTNSKQ